MPAIAKKVAHLFRLAFLLLFVFPSARAGSGFVAAPAYVVGASEPRFVVVDNFSGHTDGATDLAVVNSTGNSVTFLLGKTDGTFTPQQPILLPGISNPEFAVSIDCNHDTHPDLAVASPTSDKIAILKNPGNGTLLFTQGASIVDGSSTSPASPAALAVANLGDTYPDLVVANVQGGTSNAGTVGVFKSIGDCTFATTPVLYTVGTNPDSIVAGNFTGHTNGTVDVAVANFTSNTLTLLPANGTGGFDTTKVKTTSLATGAHPVSLAAGYFGSDQILDLVVANAGSSTVAANVQVLSGVGDGSFTTPGAILTAGLHPQSVIAADFNGDTHADIAVANADGGSISVFLYNTTTGTFNPAMSFAAGTLSTGIAAGSFDTSGGIHPDNLPDLAVANANDNTVSVLISNGGGTFVGARTYGAGTNPVSGLSTNPVSVAAAQFKTGSFPIGLAIANSSIGTSGTGNIGYISSLQGNSVSGNGTGPGDGTFKPPSPPTHVAHTNPVSVQIAADFNVDGNADLAVANYGSSDVSILTGNGSGAYHSLVTNIQVGTPPSLPSSVAIGKFNTANNNNIDIAVANSGSNNVSVLLGNGDATFQSPVNYVVGGSVNGSTCTDPVFVLATDINADGILDLVVVNATPHPDGNSSLTPGCVSILLGNGSAGKGNGTFSLTPANYAVGTTPVWVAVGDFNNDGKIDLAVANYNDGNVSVLLQDSAGGGTFTSPAANYAVCANPVAIGVMDFAGHGNGIVDLVTLDQANNFMAVLTNKADGTGKFNKIASCSTLTSNLFNLGDTPSSLVLKDLRVLGKTDLVMTNQGGNNVTVLLGN